MATNGEPKVTNDSPPKGLQFWELGEEKNWSLLGSYLQLVENVAVVDEQSEERLWRICAEIDSSFNPLDQEYLVLKLATADKDKGLKLLKRVLTLGASPGLGAASAVQRALNKDNFKCANALMQCGSFTAMLPAALFDPAILVSFFCSFLNSHRLTLRLIFDLSSVAS
jgi:hypothetical protein